MTILEFLKTKSAEEIAERISHHDEEKTDKFWSAFNIGHTSEFFDVSTDCPRECKYLESGWAYAEDWWMNGECDLDPEDPDDCEGCPYKIDRKEVLKKLVLQWLNTEVEQA